MQRRLLKPARASHAEKAAEDATRLIIGIVMRKGPCNFREIQRYCNDQRADKFKPAIKLLEQKGRLKRDDKKRYMLVPSQS